MAEPDDRKPQTPAKPGADKERREAQLAAALRANLRRRKAAKPGTAED